MQPTAHILIFIALGYFVYIDHGWALGASVALIGFGVCGITYTLDTIRGRLGAQGRILEQLRELRGSAHQLRELDRRLSSLSTSIENLRDQLPTQRNSYDYED